MDSTAKPRVVISAVNIRKGGTLTVLKHCLGYLSTRNDLDVTALVHRASLCDCPGIDFIEIPWSTKSWIHRIWCEYVTMHRISRRLQHPTLWLSLHDTTPNVIAQSQAVYCHNSFFMLHILARDWVMNPKIPLFALFTKWIYKVNAGRNKYLVVQQDWMRMSLSRALRFPKDRIILSPASFVARDIEDRSQEEAVPVFFYPSSPDCHKNIETACCAAQLLERRQGKGRFKLILTIDGTENRYAKWLWKKYSKVESIVFYGYMTEEEMYRHYSKASCLVFCSRVETWGLPISEFKQSGKPMILPDLPYAWETASGAKSVRFFPCLSAYSLTAAMSDLLDGAARFKPVPVRNYAKPFAASWDEMFEIILK